MLEPFRLGVQFSPRVWGRTSLAPWYANTFTSPVGESWLTGEMCPVETGPHAGKLLGQVEEEFGEDLCGEGRKNFPLLIKLLFPQEKLSVQVHPNDEDAARMGNGAQAKTECWYAVEAEPHGSVALGLRPGTTEADVDAAMGKPAFEDLLVNVPVSKGDMIYVEAGTVHAIAGGVTLLEVQQTSDTTYRLYDYGRPRELHLEDGRKVIRIHTAAGKVQPRAMEHGQELISFPFFTVQRIELADADHFYVENTEGPESLICLEGGGEVLCGETRLPLAVGEAVVIPACQPEYSVSGACTFIRAFVPSKHER